MTQARQVLIVEDGDLLAENLKYHLRKHGHRVEVARSGYQAIDIIEHFKPDVVISDFSMPGMNGLETIRALRIKLGSVGCVLMSAHLASDVLAQVIRFGIRHVLAKPFSLCELDALLAIPAAELALVARTQAPPGAEIVYDKLVSRRPNVVTA